jgi:hypothetical protein
LVGIIHWKENSMTRLSWPRLILGILLIAALAACSGDQQTPPPAETTAPEIAPTQPAPPGPAAEQPAPVT